MFVLPTIVGVRCNHQVQLNGLSWLEQQDAGSLYSYVWKDGFRANSRLHLTARTYIMRYNTDFLKALIWYYRRILTARGVGSSGENVLHIDLVFCPLPSATHNDLDQVTRVVRGTAGSCWIIPSTFTDGSHPLFEMIDLEPDLAHAYPYEVNLHPEVQVHSSCNLGLLLWKHSHS